MVRVASFLTDSVTRRRSESAYIRQVNFFTVFTRDSIYAIARISHGNSVRLSVCPSVCLSVRHTGGSVKNG